MGQIEQKWEETVFLVGRWGIEGIYTAYQKQGLYGFKILIYKTNV